MWKHADIPKWDDSSQSNPVLQSPTTPCLSDMWKHADTPKLDVTPLIEPCPTEPYYMMWVWHVQDCKCTQVRCTPQSEPSSTHPYYTIWVWHVDTNIWTQVQWTPLPKQTQCYTLLLHHVSLTCGCIHMNPGQMYPPLQLNPVLQSPTMPCLFHMWMNAYVTRSHVPTSN